MNEQMQDDYERLVGSDNGQAFRMAVGNLGPIVGEFGGETTVGILRFLLRYPQILTKAMPEAIASVEADGGDIFRRATHSGPTGVVSESEEP